MTQPISSPPPPDGGPPKKGPLEDLTHGLEFGLTALLGLGAGFWLDKKWGTSPGFLLGGFFLGAVLGMINLARRMK